MVELGSKAFVGNFIKRLAEIQQDGIYLLMSVESSCQIMYSYKKLCLTGPLFPKAMLVVAQDVFAFKEIHQMTVDDLFHDLAASRRHGNRSVVGSLALVSFLEEWCNISSRPVL